MQHAQEFLKAHFEEEAIKNAVKEFQEGDKELDLEAAFEAFKTFTEKDSDNKGVKTIQGLIFEEGYQNGSLKAQWVNTWSKGF